MRRLPSTLLVCIVVCAAACTTPSPRQQAPRPVIAPEITGLWTLTIESPMGTEDMDATFSQADQQLTGEVVSSGGAVPLQGTVRGEQIDFGMVLSVRGQPLQLDYSGKIEGDRMSGTVQFGPIGRGKFSGSRKVSGASGAEPK